MALKNTNNAANALSKIHGTFAVFGIIVFSKAFFFLLFTDLQKGPTSSTDHASSTPVTSNHPELILIFLAIYSVSGILVLRRLRELLRMRWPLMASVLLITLAFASASWSMVPAVSLARAVSLTGTAVFGMYLALYFNTRQQLDLLCIAFFIVSAGCFLNAALFPDLAIMSGYTEGLWNGVFTHKNKLGAIMGMAVLFYFLLGVSGTGRAVFAWMGFVLSLSLLILSYSKTALIAGSLCLALIGLLLMYQHRWRFGALAAASSIMLIATLVLQLAFNTTASIAIAELTEKEQPPLTSQERMPAESAVGEQPIRVYHSSDASNMLTGTGRTALWVRTLDFISEKPILGYGLGGFWIRSGGPFEFAEEELGWWPNHAHNGFLNLALELGLVGLVLYLIPFAWFLMILVKQACQSSFNPIFLLYPAFLSFVAIFNMGETGLLGPNQINWALFVMVIYSACGAKAMPAPHRLPPS